MEPIILLSALGSGVIGWLVQRTGDSGLNPLIAKVVKRLRRNELAKLIEIALRADSSLCAKCVSPPQVIGDNLSEAVVAELVRATATLSKEKLAYTLVTERVAARIRELLTALS